MEAKVPQEASPIRSVVLGTASFLWAQPQPSLLESRLSWFGGHPSLSEHGVLMLLRLSFPSRTGYIAVLRCRADLSVGLLPLTSALFLNNDLGVTERPCGREPWLAQGCRGSK